MRGLIILLAVMAAILATAADAGNPPPFNWNRTAFDMMTSLDTPGNFGVENTTGCVWNDEDYQLDSAAGKLSAGKTSTDTLCMVTDMGNDGAYPHTIQIDVSNSSDTLRVELTSDRGGDWALTPVKTQKAYHWQLCLPDPLWPQQAPYPPVPGTTGVGYLTRYTLSVTAQKTTNPGGEFEIGMNDFPGSFNALQLPSPPCP